MESNVKISLIICCCNSAIRLPKTLKHVANQKTNFIYEVILVDNNSNDNTSTIATEIWKSLKSNVSFEVIQESKAGLSFARKKGFDVSRGELIVYCDDDNWLDENYLQIGLDILNLNQRIGMLGGLGEEYIEGKKPIWFDKYRGFYAVGKQSNNLGDITFTNGYVYGAGVFIRKKVLSNIYDKGFISQLTDRKGKVLVSGGDNELGYIIALSGYQIFYNPKLKFKHFIPSERLNFDYIKNLKKGSQKTYFIISAYESKLFNRFYQFPKNRFSGILQTLKKLIKLKINYLNSKISNYEYELKFTQLFYRKLYQVLYYNSLKKGYLNALNNINLVSNYK